MNLNGKVEFASRTDVGRKRDHNEDAVGSDPELGLAIVADGMGGYRAGEVASAIAVNMMMDVVRAGIGAAGGDDPDEQSGFSRETLLVREAIRKANETIFQTAERQPQCQGMGTTVVAVLFHDDRMTVAHVGDSRLYRLRERCLEQLTVDHSLLQELVEKGFYTPEEAKQSLNKNLVTRAMGIDTKVDPDFQEEMVLPGDVYLLCSDGLSDLVGDQEIEATLLRHGEDLDGAAETLVRLANDAGGKDNISVVLARTLKPFPAKKSWYSRVFDWF